jgi:hypothetical protein
VYGVRRWTVLGVRCEVVDCAWCTVLGGGLCLVYGVRRWTVLGVRCEEVDCAWCTV